CVCLQRQRAPISTLFPYTQLFRSCPITRVCVCVCVCVCVEGPERVCACMKRSEEHTSELQSHLNIACRLLLEIKKLGARCASSGRCATWRRVRSHEADRR